MESGHLSRTKLRSSVSNWGWKNIVKLEGFTIAQWRRLSLFFIIPKSHQMWKPESIPELILQASSKSSKEQNKMELSLLTNTTYPFSWSILMFLWLLDAILVRLVRLVMRCVVFRLGHILSVRRNKQRNNPTRQNPRYKLTSQCNFHPQESRLR